MIGNTDTVHYVRFTHNIYRFSPTFMFPEDLKRFHGNNERISIRNYEQTINFYYHLMVNADEGALPPLHKHNDELWYLMNINTYFVLINFAKFWKTPPLNAYLCSIPYLPVYTYLTVCLLVWFNLHVYDIVNKFGLLDAKVYCMLSNTRKSSLSLSIPFLYTVTAFHHRRNPRSKCTCTYYSLPVGAMWTLGLCLRRSCRVVASCDNVAVSDF